MTTEQDNGWAYAVKSHEDAHGPFASREEAVQEAIDAGYSGCTIVVGQVQYGEPAEYVPDADELLEGINECAVDQDEYCWAEDPVFEYKTSKEEAEADLRAWAEKHLRCVQWYLQGGDDVELPKVTA